jgi:hypothetical protein
MLEPIFVADIEAFAKDSEALKGRSGNLQRASTEIGEPVVGFPNGNADIGDFQHVRHLSGEELALKVGIVGRFAREIRGLV